MVKKGPSLLLKLPQNPFGFVALLFVLNLASFSLSFAENEHLSAALQSLESQVSTIEKAAQGEREEWTAYLLAKKNKPTLEALLKALQAVENPDGQKTPSYVRSLQDLASTLAEIHRKLHGFQQMDPLLEQARPQIFPLDAPSTFEVGGSSYDIVPARRVLPYWFIMGFQPRTLPLVLATLGETFLIVERESQWVIGSENWIPVGHTEKGEPVYWLRFTLNLVRAKQTVLFDQWLKARVQGTWFRKDQKKPVILMSRYEMPWAVQGHPATFNTGPINNRSLDEVTDLTGIFGKFVDHFIGNQIAERKEGFQAVADHFELVDSSEGDSEPLEMTSTSKQWTRLLGLIRLHPQMDMDTFQKASISDDSQIALRLWTEITKSFQRILWTSEGEDEMREAFNRDTAASALKTPFQDKDELTRLKEEIGFLRQIAKSRKGPALDPLRQKIIEDLQLGDGRLDSHAATVKAYGNLNWHDPEIDKAIVRLAISPCPTRKIVQLMNSDVLAEAFTTGLSNKNPLMKAMGFEGQQLWTLPRELELAPVPEGMTGDEADDFASVFEFALRIRVEAVSALLEKGKFPASLVKAAETRPGLKTVMTLVEMAETLAKELQAAAVANAQARPCRAHLDARPKDSSPTSPPSTEK